MNKALYKPLGMIVGALGGVAATAAFKQVWKRIGDGEEPPNPTDSSYNWRQVVIAAAIQGAIFGAVKAAVDRAGAESYRKATGEWPGD